MTKKPSTVKKASVKKTGTASKIKKDALWEKLANELRKTIPKLDSEGLAFLVEQARIHLYNMQVDELNKMKEAAYSARSTASGAKSKTQKSSSAVKGKEVKIGATGSGYYLHGPKGGSMFSKNEMVKMIQIVNSPGSNLERAARLYNWLASERGDVLGALQAQDKSDPHVQMLASAILKNFKLKQI